MDSKKINNIIVILAVVVVIVAVVNLYITFIKVSDFKEKLTGYASKGYVNISVASMIQISIINPWINFTGGGVNSTCERAMLTTYGTGDSIVLCGNWSAVAHGITLENSGNINCTLTAQGTNAAATFIGGTTPAYQWNVTAEPGACSGNVLTLGVFRTANTSAAATICTDLNHEDGKDGITLDVNITVPSDASTGDRSDTITFIASAQS